MAMHERVRRRICRREVSFEVNSRMSDDSLEELPPPPPKTGLAESNFGKKMCFSKIVPSNKHHLGQTEKYPFLPSQHYSNRVTALSRKKIKSEWWGEAWRVKKKEERRRQTYSANGLHLCLPRAHSALTKERERSRRDSS